MGPHDRDDLLSLMASLQAIEAADPAKALVCRELHDKLQRCLGSGWLKPAAPGRAQSLADREASPAAPVPQLGNGKPALWHS